MSTKESIIILGSGPAGSLLGCYLAERGFEIEIFERRDDMRKTNISAGRSINLALSTRGITALAGVGLKEEVMKISIPMTGRMMHSIDGKLTYQPYSKDGNSCIYSVSRGDLNCKLMSLAEKKPGVNIHFNMKCTDLNLRTGEVFLENEITKEIKRVKGKTIFGTDGAYSAVRSSLTKLNRVDFSQSYLAHGYKELHLPPGPSGEHLIEKNCLHIWPRSSFMMIALPNLDGSFTCTCFFPYEGLNGFDFLDNASDEEVESFFKKNFGDALSLMPTLVKDFKNNPTSSLVTMRCFPWSFKDKALILGDAAHAIVPFFGQGMNCAFEDCYVFNELIDKYGIEDLEKLYITFQESRKPNADAIADMALENFIEMRDKVSDKHFLFKKKVQHKLGNEFPGRFLSRYELVSFTTKPYSEAVLLGEKGDKLTEELIKDIDDEDITKVDMSKATILMEKYFPNSIL